MANDLPIAFPPIVNEAAIAEDSSVTNNIFIWVIFDRFVAIVAVAVPEIIPHVSPTISQHSEDTLGALFSSLPQEKLLLFF